MFKQYLVAAIVIAFLNLALLVLLKEMKYTLAGIMKTLKRPKKS